MLQRMVLKSVSVRKNMDVYVNIMVTDVSNCVRLQVIYRTR